MEEPKELILPATLIFFGFLVFLYPAGSDVPLIEDTLSYLCSAPFLLTGCFILSNRLGAVKGPKINLANGLLSTEDYIEYKKNEKVWNQQSIGYTIMFGSAISAAAIFIVGFISLGFLAALSFGSTSNSLEDVFFFFWGLLKICFWIYVGSHVLIARPWQYFGGNDGDKPVEEKRLIQCPACNATMRVPIAYTGRARCPACGEEFKT